MPQRCNHPRRTEPVSPGVDQSGPLPVLHPRDGAVMCPLDRRPDSLVIVSANERIQEQLGVTGITGLIGAGNVYEGDERIGATVKRAHDDAVAWVEDRQRP